MHVIKKYAVKPLLNGNGHWEGPESINKKTGKGRKNERRERLLKKLNTFVLPKKLSSVLGIKSTKPGKCSTMFFAILSIS